jgi:hypothetical protein
VNPFPKYLFCYFVFPFVYMHELVICASPLSDEILLSCLGKWFLGSVGTGFTPHVIIIQPGEVSLDEH